MIAALVEIKIIIPREGTQSTVKILRFRTTVGLLKKSRVPLYNGLTTVNCPNNAPVPISAHPARSNYEALQNFNKSRYDVH